MNNFDPEINELYQRYVEANKENHPYTKIDSLVEIYENVREGLLKNEQRETISSQDLLENIKAALRAMVVNAENDTSEMIKRAEQDYGRRYEEMTEQQKQVCDQFRMSFAKMNDDVD